MTSKNKLSYLQREKGKYAYSTGNRVFVWKNIIWPLILEVNRPWFTLKEYRTKRDEVSDTIALFRLVTNASVQRLRQQIQSSL